MGNSPFFHHHHTSTARLWVLDGQLTKVEYANALRIPFCQLSGHLTSLATVDVYGFFYPKSVTDLGDRYC